MNFNRKWLLKLIGPIIFILILIFKIDFGNFFLAVKGINLNYFLITLIILIIGSLISPFRWYYILKRFSINYSFFKIFKINYLTNLLGTITPGRVGEIIGKIGFLKKHGHEINKSLISIIISRLADLFLLLLFALVGLLILPHIWQNNLVTILLFCLLTLFIIPLLLNKNFFKKAFIRIFVFLIPSKFKTNWLTYFKNFLQALSKLSYKNYSSIFLITILDWLIIFSALYLLALSLGINTISFSCFSAAIALSRLVGLLPISISGLGTREAILLIIFSEFQISPEKTIAFSLISFVIALLMGMSIGLYAWLTEKI